MTADELRTGMQVARDHGFLWRLDKDGRRSYLYGTVHLARRDWMLPGPAVLDAVRSSDIIALELDPLDEGTVQRLQAGMRPQPERALPATLEERLRLQLEAACLTETLMTTLAPEMVAMTLTTLAARQDGLDPSYGIDVTLAGLARGLRKPVHALETPELQSALLLGGTPQESQELVEEMLDQLETGRAREMLNRIATVWGESRHAELESYEQWCECLDSAVERLLYRRLLDERNPALAEHIDKLHRSGHRVFAAVGSLHMTGTTGLPLLMARRGYRVERIEFRR